MTGAGPRVVFLQLRGMHHVYHSILTAFELSRMQQEVQVEVVASDGPNRSLIEKVARWYPDHRATFTYLPMPWYWKPLDPNGGRYPSPFLMFLRAVPRLRSAAAFVTAAHDDEEYARWLRVRKARAIFQQHGGGDGAYTFEPKLRGFDLLLTTGEHLRRRYQAEGIGGPERVKVVGSPKLDLFRFHHEHARLPFTNGKPVVLYAPHWRPSISSLPGWGRRVLDAFAERDDLNLVFAPHLLVKQWARRFGYDLDFSRWERCANIHVDLGSERSVDLTYTSLADVYLGDVSSQVVEWVACRPRPCVFLNAHGVRWREDPSYRFWAYGPVVESWSPAALDAALEQSREPHWQQIQAERSQEYIDRSDVPSSVRAAREILACVREAR